MPLTGLNWDRAMGYEEHCRIMHPALTFTRIVRISWKFKLCTKLTHFIMHKMAACICVSAWILVLEGVLWWCVVVVCCGGVLW